MDKHNAPDPNKAQPQDTARKGNDVPQKDEAIKPNPPRTTKWGITAPKFGSAGSGGAEIEPGPERD